MTVADLLALAHDVASNGSECDSPAEKLALAVQELLEVDALPSGYDRPGIWPNREGPHVVIPRQWAGPVRCDEARALFVVGLKACDEAERGGK